MENLDCRNVFAYATCDYCGEIVFAVNLADSNLNARPHVNAYGVLACLPCADRSGIIVAHRFEKAADAQSVCQN